MPIDLEHDDINTALKKLKAREENLKLLESVSGLGSWEVDLRTKESIWSDRSYEIYGIEKGSKVTLDLFFSRLVPEDRPLAQQAINKAIQSLKPVHFECRVHHTNGKKVYLLINGQAILDNKGEPLKLIGTTQDITEHVNLQTRDKELSNLLEHSSNEIYIANMKTLNYLYVNEGAIKALGYSYEEFLQMNVRDINPYLKEDKITELEQALHSTQHVLNRSIHERKDGSQYHVQSYIHTLKYKDQDAFVIFDTDISQEVELEQEYKKQAKILEHIHDSVISTDVEGYITSWNRGSFSLFGYTADEVIGKSILNIYDEINEYKVPSLFKLLQEKGNIDIEAYMISKENKSILCDISLSISRDTNDKVDGYIGYIQDITQQKEIERKLEEQQELLHYQANHDALTDLPNRALFKDRLSQTIITAKRYNKKFALLFIDLDQFKKINDTLGHHIGDKVLIEAAKRIKSVLREEDTLSRLGGDEFTVIINDIHKLQDPSVVAQKIIDVMKEPIKITSQNLYVTSSIGVSIYPDDATNNENLIKYADVAMYNAKDKGRNNYQFYSSDMTAFAFERVVMESSLRVAIKEEQFIVYYQPQIDVKTEKIVGMEALVRWLHPKLGLVPPGKFIPLAEESGLIIEIDRLVMKQAIAQVSAWYKEGLNPGLLSLNLAMKQLNEENFLFQLVSTMEEEEFQADWLELEVTEGQVMQNPQIAIEKLKTLNKLGIEIAIDDFGTGYSSLSYLKKLPLDKLKIDQSFVRDIPKDEDDMAITKAIIALGKSLNLTIIAEGVEDEQQRDFLVEHGCDLIQGYFYSRPIPADEMKTLLEANET